MIQELTIEAIREIISHIKYKNWSFFVAEMGNGFFIQVRFNEADAYSGEIKEQHGRKWYVSKHSVADEIVRTCFLAVITAAEHEIRESFHYKNKSIFGPHISVDYLESISKKIVKRKEANK